MRKFVIIVLIIIAVIIVGFVLLFLSAVHSIKGTQTTGLGEEEKVVQENNDVNLETDLSPDYKIETGVPSELSLPFNVEDVDPENGEVNPLGVVRFDKDQPDFGHSGIDIPLFEGSPVYAVADGRVVNIQSASDPWGGIGLFQLLRETGPGEGWAFIYEHIDVADFVSEGMELKRGDLVGTKKPPEGFTMHFQLSRVFNDFQYTSDLQCWPDFLSEGEKEKIESWWIEYGASEHLINSWETTEENGKFPFKGLLEMPGGPQLCYQLGTDVR